jgi:cytosine/adenosine deaminase-related metal-dependent hydrolase
MIHSSRRPQLVHPLSSSSTLSLQARVVCPIAGPPVENGVVEIAESQIVGIHRRPHVRTVDLGCVALLPGLVNCHTHLEFSNLAQPLGPPGPFAAWISSVVSERRRRCRPAEPSSGIRVETDPIAHGLAECFRTGTSLVGDIATGRLIEMDDSAPVVDALRSGRLIPFRELLAPTSTGVETTWQAADEYLEDLESVGVESFAGLSPHAPYTVTSRLLDQAAERATRESRPVAMHVAETLEELEFLEHRTGPLVEMLERVGQWAPSTIEAASVMDILERLSLAPRALVVHGNFLGPRELKFLGERPHLSLVYCPRTHAYFQHSRYPLAHALELGVNVALGTDSRASNPDLNLWEEVKEVARQFPSLDSNTVLRMATANGARALGHSSTQGALEPGRRADLCCIALDSTIGDSVRAAVGREAKVVGAMHSGRWLLDPTRQGS